MPRIYTVVAQGTYTNAGGDIDLVSIQPADDKPCKLLGFSIGQISEVGDAAEEGIRISVLVLPSTVTIGSGGSSPTPVNVDDPTGGSSAGFTARVLDTTVATTIGTTRTVQEHGWNERASPYDFFYPDDTFAPGARQGEAIIIRGQTTVADDMTVAITAWVQER